jgi:DNA modification methylase
MIAPLPAEELLDFGSDTAFRRQLQPAGARRHPGKLHLGFLAWLLDRYTRPGDTLLDPLAGSGSLLMATLPPWRCRVLLNELEIQWVLQICATWQHLCGGLVPPVGTAQVAWGDARTLAARLAAAAGVDLLFTSPPYADALTPQPRDYHPERQGITHPATTAQVARMAQGYDAILTSPPYADALNGPASAGLQAYYRAQRPQGFTSLLAGGSYDAVLTSPPYADALTRQPHQQDYSKEPATAHWHSTQSAQNLRGGYDTILTSPPYADALNHQRHGEDYHPERQSGHPRGRNGDAALQAIRRGYDAPADGQPPASGVRNPAQIGNLGGARYQAAMAEVYAQCAQVVRPGGLIIVILKNIVRDHQVVDLVGLAAGQLSTLGCIPVATHWRKVRLGPFHAIRRKAHPATPIIDREAALVFRRPSAVLSKEAHR